MTIPFLRRSVDSTIRAGPAFACAILVALGATGCSRSRPAARSADAHLATRNHCDYRPGGSRWAPRRARYVLSAEFGQAAGEALIDLWGVSATPSGQILLYDAGATHVLRLDRDLHRIGAFGREGSGPGEFSYQRVLAGDWITASDSLIFVLDLRSISEFDSAGRFLRYAARPAPFPLPIRRIAVHSGRLLYAVDDFSREDGRRSLQTWSIKPSHRPALVRVDSMPTLPESDGRVYFGLFVLQADPLWAARGRCAFISDGAHDWILRVDLDTNQTDTLRLPPRKPARLTSADRRWLGLGRAAASRASNRRFHSVRPTARLKWADIRIDPDGYVWLQPWLPKSATGHRLEAWVVDPATGAVDSVRVRHFPVAFLPDGSILSRAYDPASGVILVQRYTLTATGARP